MLFPNSRARIAAFSLLIAVFMVAAAACSSNGPGSDGNSPTATPTDIVVVVQTETPVPTATPTPISAVPPQPTRTPAPTSPSFPPMEVVFLEASEFGEPAFGTVYEELLARTPDNEATRTYAKLSDYAGVMEFLSIARPEPGASEAELEPFFDELGTAWREGFGPEFPAWPLRLRDYASSTNWYPYMAFDLWSVDQSVNAGSTFIPSLSGGTGDTQVYDIALGQFDPEQTADALADCQCDQPTINVHDGVEYYSWSEEGQEFIGEIERRHDPPIYDHVGRGPQVLVREGEAYYATPHAVMEEMIDIFQGNEPSLADDVDYVAATRRLASLGLMNHMLFLSVGFSMEEVLARPATHDAALFEEVLRKTELFEPFDMVATGTGFDGERAFTGFVISNPDEATANRNAEVFAERLREIPTSVRSDDTHADNIELVEIAVDGNLLVARIYFNRVELHQFGFPIPFNTTWLVYE